MVNTKAKRTSSEAFKAGAKDPAQPEYKKIFVDGKHVRSEVQLKIDKWLKPVGKELVKVDVILC